MPGLASHTLMRLKGVAIIIIVTGILQYPNLISTFHTCARALLLTSIGYHIWKVVPNHCALPSSLSYALCSSIPAKAAVKELATCLTVG